MERKSGRELRKFVANNLQRTTNEDESQYNYADNVSNSSASMVENCRIEIIGEGSSTTIVSSVINSTSSENTASKIINDGDTNEAVRAEDKPNGLDGKIVSVNSTCGNILPANKLLVGKLKCSKPIAVVKPFLRRPTAQPINTGRTSQPSASVGNIMRLLESERNHDWYYQRIYANRRRAPSADGMRQHSTHTTGTTRRVHEHLTYRRHAGITEGIYIETVEIITPNGTVTVSKGHPLPERNSHEMYGIPHCDEPSANLVRPETEAQSQHAASSQNLDSDT